ncbi:hypothetical protein [Dermatophilus congolensis]|uniref:hypothetical protein n=1 Tax=Dermatophilus congolensis TaxID=1863 RepID=UPI001AAF432D|nr:hypothetical protein [Dermatophilus congolensis]MBO3130079.1 hypothetical protein [Dermatophilus congolensis]MBO3131294.1 hypothetical protein [Dermatophilus congolensis]MBO3134550.1 hypothetical protein [Dermatophilus congolensis]MBO3136787.1 hypothetical protein [Dermatophilus congolensis]MBO3139031.1 hypothetical protein [Dermatophilus congolensis]
MECIHTQGWAYGDLNPSNVIIASDGGVSLIDWEQADLLSNFKMSFGTAGYVGPDPTDGLKQDNFALYRLAIHLLTGRLGPLQMFPDHDCANLSFIERVYGEKVLRQIKALRNSAVPLHDQITSIFKDASPQLPTSISLRSGFLSLTEGKLKSSKDSQVKPLGVGVEAYQPDLRYTLWGGETGLSAALRASGAPLLSLENKIFNGCRESQFRSLGFFSGISGYAAASVDISKNLDDGIW